MTVPLPASGSTNWYSHYQRMDTLSKESTFRNANRVAFLGDSITSINGTGDNVSAFEGSHDNWSTLLPTMSGGRMQWARSFATGGLTSPEIRDVVLPRLLAVPAAQLPGTVIILGGTNDVGVGVTQAATITALTDIINTLRANEIRPVLCTVPPRGDDTTANQNANRLNAMINGLARQLGAPLIDMYGALIDSATGGFVTGTDIGDGVHPNVIGMMMMAQAGIDSGVLEWLPPWEPPLVKTTADTADLTSGWGLFLTGGGGYGASWDNIFTSDSSSATGELITPTAGDGCFGQWQRVTRPPGVGRTYLQKYVTTGFSAGDLISMDVRIRYSGLNGSGINAGGSGPGIGLGFRNSSNATLDVIDFACSRDITGVVHLERRVPATTTTIVLDFGWPGPTTGTAIYDIGQVTARNLTTLGLA